MLGAVADRAELGAHAVLGDHRAGDLGGLVDVGRRAGGRLAEHQFLGRAATHREHQPRDHLRAGHQALVVLGHRHGVSAGAAAGQDRHLVDGLDVGHRPGRQGVAALVIGGDLLLVLADDPALAARTTDHAVDRLLERGAGDDGAVLPGGEQRGLVDDVGQVGAGHADGALGQTVEVGVRRRSACPASAPAAPRGDRPGRGWTPGSAGRSGRGAAAPDPGCRAGWWPRSG